MNINIPEVATKQLQLQKCSAGRKLVISTNLLKLFGFNENENVTEELIGENKGIRIALATSSEQKQKKVYTRTYPSRKNNPIETMLDIRSQTLLNKAFPQDTEKVHIVFRQGEILITPITNKQAQAIKNFKKTDNILSTFLACSSGVDGKCLEDDGFTIEIILEYRPNEKRDKTDFTESGAINAISNISAKYLINEDIMNLDLEKIAEMTSQSNMTFGHFSIQCDDFSQAKAKSLKESSVEDTSSTLDMVLDVLNIVSKFRFPTLLLENVRGFSTSDIGAMTRVRLQRLGYKVYDGIYDARDFGGMTSRVRNYLFATMLPAKFIPPEQIERNTKPFWDEIIEPLLVKDVLRDITHTKSYQDGLTTKRARLITRESVFSPSFLKSQMRQAKDSVYIYDEVRGKAYFPTNELTASLMGIKNMNFDSVSKTIESEIIGQSVEVPLHAAILKSVKEHILSADAQLHNRLF